MIDRVLKICWGRGGDLGVLHRDHVEVLKPKTDTPVWSTAGSCQNQQETIFKLTPDRIYIEGSTSRRFGDLGSQFYSYADGNVLVHSEGKSSIVACHPELHYRSTGEWSRARKNSIYFTNRLGQIEEIDLTRGASAAQLIYEGSGNVHTEVLNSEALITVKEDGTILLIDLRCRPPSARHHGLDVSPEQVLKRPIFDLCVIPDSTNCLLLDSTNDQLKYFDWRDSTELHIGSEVWSLSRMLDAHKVGSGEMSCSTRPASADSLLSELYSERPQRWRCLALTSSASVCVGSVNVPLMSDDCEPVVAQYDLRRRILTGYLGLGDLQSSNCCTSLAASGEGLAGVTCCALAESEVMARARLLPFFKT